MGTGNHKDGSHNGANTRSRRVHPRYKNPLAQDSDVTRIPTTPHWQATSVEQAPIWQYESPDYEVESSISSLSLVVPEIPTHSSIEEIDTRPALPVEQASPVRAGVPAKRRSRGRNPLDRVRWWLLYPGRIEFVLWLCGTVLLIGVTCMLLLVTAFSFEWITPGQQSGMALQNLANNSVSSTNPALMVIDPGPFSPGQVIRLHGQGFSTRGRIVFTFDSTALQLGQNVASGLVHQPHVDADDHGEFIVSLTLGSGPAWKAGRHSIVAHDIATNHLALLSILLVPYRATLTPVPSTKTGNQNGSVHATPIATTPPPAKSTPPPVVRPTATPTKAPPTPTPTAKPSPTATATPTPAVTTN